MELDMVVAERKETLAKGVELTIRAHEPEHYYGYWSLLGTAHPDVHGLQVGDRLRVTIETIPLVAVSAVEETIEEAERAPFHLAEQAEARIAGVAV